MSASKFEITAIQKLSTDDIEVYITSLSDSELYSVTLDKNNLCSKGNLLPFLPAIRDIESPEKFLFQDLIGETVSGRFVDESGNASSMGPCLEIAGSENRYSLTQYPSLVEKRPTVSGVMDNLHAEETRLQNQLEYLKPRYELVDGVTQLRITTFSSDKPEGYEELSGENKIVLSVGSEPSIEFPVELDNPRLKQLTEDVSEGEWVLLDGKEACIVSEEKSDEFLPSIKTDKTGSFHLVSPVQYEKWQKNHLREMANIDNTFTNYIGELIDDDGHPSWYDIRKVQQSFFIDIFADVAIQLLIITLVIDASLKMTNNSVKYEPFILFSVFIGTTLILSWIFFYMIRMKRSIQS